MNRTATFRIADDVTWDHSDGQVVILNAEGSQMITLNEVGSILWPELGEPTGVEGLVSVLGANFDGITPEKLREDVTAFIDELVAEGLITDSPQ